jgi:outer membrane protein assembly factor BamD
MIFFFCGCAMWDRFFSEEEMTPAELMKEGIENYEKGYFESATTAFQKVKDRYPYSKYALEAELKMADSFYMRDLYNEAYDAYSEFEKLHPKNPKIPYVIYQRGMSQYSQVKSIDRDQSHTIEAKEEFERLVKNFPKSEYTKKAALKIRQCYIYLAKYELYVGHFYYKMEKYRTAVDRYRSLLKNYPDFGQYHEALEYIYKSREKLAEESRKNDESWWKSLTSPLFD